MAGGMYRVFELTQKEAELNEEGAVVEEFETLTENELIKRFAPGFNLADPTETALVNEWLKAFIGSEAVQKASCVRVEKLDAHNFFEDKRQEFADLEKQARAAKKELADAMVGALSDITPEKIAEGEIHATSANGKTKVGIVEYYIAKSKAAVKDVIAKHGASFSEEVQAELAKVNEKREREAESRKG